MVLGGIGMVECGRFLRHGHTMLIYESRRTDEPRLEKR